MSLGILAAGIGGLLGASGNKGSSAQSQKMDPRMDRFVYGDSGQGGLLGDAHNLYKQQMAQGGMNPMMQAGLEGQRQVLTSPQYTQGYNNLMNLGQGLLGGGVAGNPFTQSNAQMPQANMDPFMNGGLQYQSNPSLMGAMNPIQSQGIQPSDLSQTKEVTPAQSAIEKLGPYGKAMFDQFKAIGMPDEQAYQMAMNYGSNGFDGGA